jgi:hypothetical protein
MSIGTTSELFEFHQFVAQKLASPDQKLSPEEVLELWREEHPTPEDYANTVAALREAIQAYEAGDRGIPVEEFDREFRARHGLG